MCKLIMKTFSRIFLAAIILSLGFSACKDKVDPPTETPFNKYDTITNFQGLLIPTTGKLKVNVNYVFGKDSLELNTKFFNTLGGDTFVLTLIRHYLSNFTLFGPEGKINLKNYQLLNFADKASRSFVINGVPPSIYHKLEMIIGVDSLNNSSGLQEGALDPAYSMFWTWATGYIFFKLEGKTIKDRTFSLHTGGNKVFPYNEVDLTSYKVKSIEPTLNLTIDIKEMLENPNAYNFERDGYDVHSPANSSNDKILENMKDMVKLSSLNN